MPWKEVLAMEEIMRFVLSVKAGELSFARLCRRYEISRETGYKWWRRFEAGGLEGIYERSSRPHNCPHQSPGKWRQRVERLRKRYPYWGPKKLRVKLQERYGPGGLPAASTLGRMLVRAGLVRRPSRRRWGPVLEPIALKVAHKPNEVWAVDFKGWFRSGNGQRCDPLTVSDGFSRYILGCQVMVQPQLAGVQRQFKHWLKRYGQPEMIRVDNGPPFGSQGAGGLSALSVWWLSLGIGVEFITPGCPQENGAHERMHRTLKAEATRPPAYTPAAQQRRFDNWIREFNQERPHEALGQVTPASLYRVSQRKYVEAIKGWSYAAGWAVRKVRSNGQIRWRGRLRFIGEAFYGQQVGLLEVGPGHHQVHLGNWLLGELQDEPPGGIQPAVRVGRRPAKLKKWNEAKVQDQRRACSCGRGESVTRSDRRPREL